MQLRKSTMYVFYVNFQGGNIKARYYWLKSECDFNPGARSFFQMAHMGAGVQELEAHKQGAESKVEYLR